MVSSIKESQGPLSPLLLVRSQRLVHSVGGHLKTLVAIQIISYKRRKMLRYLSVSSAAKKNLEAKKAANIQKEIDRNYTEKKAKQQFIEERIKLNQSYCAVHLH